MRQSAPGMHWLRWIMRWTFKVALCLSFTENICCFGSKQMATTCHLSDSVESSNLKSNPKKACQPCVAWMNLPEIDSIGDIKRKDLVQCLDLVPIIEQSSNFLMVDEYRGLPPMYSIQQHIGMIIIRGKCQFQLDGATGRREVARWLGTTGLVPQGQLTTGEIDGNC